MFQVSLRVAKFDCLQNFENIRLIDLFGAIFRNVP